MKITQTHIDSARVMFIDECDRLDRIAAGMELGDLWEEDLYEFSVASGVETLNGVCLSLYGRDGVGEGAYLRKPVDLQATSYCGWKSSVESSWDWFSSMIFAPQDYGAFFVQAPTDQLIVTGGAWLIYYGWHPEQAQKRRNSS